METTPSSRPLPKATVFVLSSWKTKGNIFIDERLFFLPFVRLFPPSLLSFFVSKKEGEGDVAATYEILYNIIYADKKRE